MLAAQTGQETLGGGAGVQEQRRSPRPSRTTHL